MKRALLVCVAGLLIAADAKDDDLKKLQGSWETSAVFNGKKAPDSTVVIKDSTYAVLDKDGKKVEEGTLKLDPSKKPKAIDSTASEGTDKGQTMLGIYEFDGDTIKICFARVGKDRPKEFVSKEGSDTVLFVMKKMK